MSGQQGHEQPEDVGGRLVPEDRLLVLASVAITVTLILMKSTSIPKSRGRTLSRTSLARRMDTHSNLAVLLLPASIVQLSSPLSAAVQHQIINNCQCSQPPSANVLLLPVERLHGHAALDAV